MNAVSKKVLWFSLFIIVGATGIIFATQSIKKSQARKRSHAPQTQTKSVTGTGMPGGITKELAQKNPQLLKEIQDKLLKGEASDHDTPRALVEIGDISSVPAMLAVLKRNPMRPDGLMICTRAHCLAALIKLTGNNVGKTTEAWEKWWEGYKKTH